MTGRWTKEDQEYWDKPENRLLFEFNCLFTSKNYWELNQHNVKPMNEDLRKLFKNFLEKLAKRVEPEVSQPSEPSFGQWIDVKDKLPERNIDVLVFSDYGDHTDTWVTRLDKYWKNNSIIKWMPLPKP